MLKKLLEWIGKSGPGTSYHGFHDRLCAVHDRLSDGDPSVADTDSEAAELIAEIEAINPQHLDDLARIRSAAGMAPLNPSPTASGKGRWGPDKEKRKGSGKGKGKQSKHDRKARAMEKRDPGFDDLPEEDRIEVAAESEIGERPGTMADAAPRTLRDSERDRVTEALAGLRYVANEVSDDEAIRDNLDEDFREEHAEAVSFAQGILAANTVETPLFIDNLERQVAGLQDRLEAAEDKIVAEEEARHREEEEARRREEEEARRREEEEVRRREEEDARRREEEEVRRREEEEALLAPPAASPAKQKKKKKGKKKSRPMSLADLEKWAEKETGVKTLHFPADFEMKHCRRVVYDRTEVLSLDARYQDEARRSAADAGRLDEAEAARIDGFCTCFYTVEHAEDSPFRHLDLVIHAHFDGANQYRSAPKVMENEHEGLLGGSSGRTGSAKAKDLRDYAANLQKGIRKP